MKRLMLAILLLASLACAQPEAVPQIESATLTDPAKVIQMGKTSVWDFYFERRKAVLSLWVDGKPVDVIAARTGYKVPGVITTIRNYEAAVKKRRDEIDALGVHTSSRQ